MGKNVIYYGPPGTGKTYNLQKLKSRYTSYEISNEQIETAFNRKSDAWLLLVLIILQNNNQPMRILIFRAK